MFDLSNILRNSALAAIAEQVKQTIETAPSVQIIEEKCHIFLFSDMCKRSGLDPGQFVEGLFRLKECGVIDAFNLDDNERYLMVRRESSGPQKDE